VVSVILVNAQLPLQGRAVRQAAKQLSLVTRQPAVKSAEMTALERKQNA
jgi:hypothetical protein